MLDTGEHETGANMDEWTRREIDDLKKRVARSERRSEIHEKYLPLIGVELGGVLGHLKRALEFVNDMMSELKKI